MQQRENKEWYNREDILSLYPIGITTYKQRIKKLNTSELSGYTRMIIKPLNNSNLKTIQVREIHGSIINELFGYVRVPNIYNTSHVKKWVNNFSWDWFGNIVPCKTYPNELKSKMNFLFRKLKKKCKGGNVTLFYSIEKNTKDSYFHSHFLIKDDLSCLDSEIITSQLELVCDKNNATDKRIYLVPYDYQNHGANGSNYTLKDFRYGYEILK